MAYKIRNWDKYQARKSRGSNPWIKLYKKLLESADYFRIPVERRWEWTALMLMADDNTGIIDLSDDEIAFRLRVDDWNPEVFKVAFMEPLDASGIPVVDQRLTSGGVEEKRREEKRNRLSEQAPTIDGEEEFFGYFPTIEGDWPFCGSSLDVLESAYGDPDRPDWVFEECKAAKAWLQSNPSRQKTKRGMMKFLNGWLKKAKDGGGAARADRKRMAVAGRADRAQAAAHRSRNGTSTEAQSITEVLEELT